MKKFTPLPFVTLLVLTIFAISKSVVQAQSSIDYGIKGGINFANLVDNPTDPDAQTGLLIGGYLNYKFPNSPISLEPEILFTQKGAEGSNVEIEVNYLEIPVLAKWNFSTEGNFTPNIYAGPYLAFELDTDTQSSVPVAEPDTQTDFGGVVGLGTDIKAGMTVLSVEGRYTYGFVDAFDNASDRNSVFSIVVGIGI